jgi:hypothetical protein
MTSSYAALTAFTTYNCRLLALLLPDEIIEAFAFTKRSISPVLIVVSEDLLINAAVSPTASQSPASIAMSSTSIIVHDIICNFPILSPAAEPSFDFSSWSLFASAAAATFLPAEVSKLAIR